VPITLSLADQVCLAVIGEQRTHGWALVKLLAPEGELGRIWSLSRPLTYRSIDRLVEAGLVERTEIARRAELRITSKGRRRRRAWLDTPVVHLRDLRTEFLLKLTLRDRSGLASGDLIEQQRELLDPAISSLVDKQVDGPVDLWRQESASGARRFLDRVAELDR